MTIFLTILSGVTVYVLGQMILKFVIDPIHQQRETTGKIIDFLIFHANRYTNPGLRNTRRHGSEAAVEKRKAELMETKTTGRQLASDLMVKTQAIPWYDSLERMGWVLKRSNIREAQEGLFFISNSVFQDDQALPNYDASEKIRKALGVVTEFQIDRPEQEQEQEPAPAQPPEQDQNQDD